MPPNAETGPRPCALLRCIARNGRRSRPSYSPPRAGCAWPAVATGRMRPCCAPPRWRTASALPRKPASWRSPPSARRPRPTPPPSCSISRTCCNSCMRPGISRASSGCSWASSPQCVRAGRGRMGRIVSPSFPPWPMARSSPRSPRICRPCWPIAPAPGAMWRWPGPWSSACAPLPCASPPATVPPSWRSVPIGSSPARRAFMPGCVRRACGWAC